MSKFIISCHCTDRKILQHFLFHFPLMCLIITHVEKLRLLSNAIYIWGTTPQTIFCKTRKQNAITNYLWWSIYRQKMFGVNSSMETNSINNKLIWTTLWGNRVVWNTGLKMKKANKLRKGKNIKIEHRWINKRIDLMVSKEDD